MEVYLVGGAVRDQLLGLPIRERDWVVVGATPEKLLKQGFRSVGKDFPVFLHPQTQEEYALARTERKTAPGYRGFVVHADDKVSLTEDLRRRDLTINAMAQTATGEIVDPYHGQADLQHRWLRHVSDAFVEDPVRVLRIARFQAKLAPFNFRVAPETLELLKKMVAAGEVDALVPERVFAELVKALATSHPGAFFEVLNDCEALPRIFPHLIWNTDRAWALRNATAMTEEVRVRWAALMWRQLGAETLSKHLKLPVDWRDLAKMAAKHGDWATDAEGLLNHLERLDALRRPERFNDWLTVARANDIASLEIERLKQAQTAAVDVQVKPLLAQGLQGEALAKALRAARKNAIADIASVL